ncbi:MAG: hypothetical protein VB055_06310 [Oscillospiraceae bacterium]|nr:hypothetical protein [Oscillospiraceae bacterium]
MTAKQRTGITIFSALLDAIPVVLESLISMLPTVIETIAAILPGLVQGIADGLLLNLPLIITAERAVT